MSFAKAFITGTVTKTPEKRFTQNDMAIASFTVNIDNSQETALRVVAFGQLAETVSNTISQGDSVAVEGRLQINAFKLPNGKDKRVYEISANTIEKISGTQSTPIAQNAQSDEIVQFNEPQAVNDEIAQDLIDEDEIPF